MSIYAEQGAFEATERRDDGVANTNDAPTRESKNAKRNRKNRELQAANESQLSSFDAKFKEFQSLWDDKLEKLRSEFKEERSRHLELEDRLAESEALRLEAEAKCEAERTRRLEAEAKSEVERIESESKFKAERTRRLEAEAKVDEERSRRHKAEDKSEADRVLLLEAEAKIDEADAGCLKSDAKFDAESRRDSVFQMVSRYQQALPLAENKLIRPSFSSEHGLCKISSQNFGEEIPQSFKLNFKNSEGQLITSTLCDHFGKDELPHTNEATAASYFCRLLADACRCARLEVEVHQEMTIFAHRPDIVVARHMKSVVCIFEVKNPGVGVFTSELAAGHVLNYALGMVQMGNQYPFVCLTTYS